MTVYDTVIIGAGLAGLTTACHLIQAKQRVMVVSYGVGSLVLAPGGVDVLGYQPAASHEPVKQPFRALAAFMEEQPEHPYHFIGQGKLEAAMQSFRKISGYQQNGSYNWLVPSTAGAIHPTYLAPQSIANGHVGEGGSMLIVGFEDLRDFYPALISQNLNAQHLGIQSEALLMPLPEPAAGNPNITPLELAACFEQADFRRRFISLIAPRCQNVERVGFPAVLGLHHHAAILAELETELGKTVFEISTLPPSVPGRRLFETLKHQIVEGKGRLVIGSKVVSATIEAGAVSHIQIETASRLQPIKAKQFVLASGGIFGGGIETTDDGQVSETIFQLPIAHDTHRQTWFGPKFVSPNGQPISRYGVRVNDRFNPVDEAGQPIADNLYVIGATLAQADWTQGRTGDGVAIGTAYKVAELLQL